MTRSLEGGCLCGALRYRIADASPLDSGYCHCRLCQRNSGAPVVAYASFAIEIFAWVAGTPKTYAASAEGKRLFCGDCGSYVAFLGARHPAEISINTTSLDHPEAAPPTRHIFIESRCAWFEIGDALPRLEGYGPVTPIGVAGREIPRR